MFMHTVVVVSDGLCNVEGYSIVSKSFFFIAKGVTVVIWSCNIMLNGLYI